VWPPSFLNRGKVIKADADEYHFNETERLAVGKNKNWADDRGDQNTDNKECET
jgi:hypothetical protein